MDDQTSERVARCCDWVALYGLVIAPDLIALGVPAQTVHAVTLTLSEFVAALAAMPREPLPTAPPALAA